MFINLYIHPRSVESQKTLDVLTRHDISFFTHYSDDPEPVVDVSTPDDTLVWRGHRPDLIELLADLDGVVPARAVMRAAMRGASDVLTRAQVHARITRSAKNPQAFFDECGDQPLYRGATVFWWLRHYAMCCLCPLRSYDHEVSSMQSGGVGACHSARN